MPSMQLPIYDAPQVAARGLPSTGLNIQAPNLGAAIGQGLGAVASVADQIAAKAKHDADATVVQSKLNELQAYRNSWDEQEQTLTPKQIQDPEFFGGKPGQAYADVRHADVSNQYELMAKNLTPDQRRLFDSHAIPAIETDRHRSTLREFALIKQDQLDTIDVGISTLGDAAEKSVEKNGNFGWDKFEEARTQAETLARRKAALTGADGDQAAKEATAFLTERAAKTLLLRSNSTDAQSLIESYSEILTPKVRDYYLEKAKGINDGNTVSKAANDALLAGMNSATKTIDDTAIKKHLEAVFPLEGGDPKLRKEALSEALHNASLQKETWAAQDNANLQPIMRALVEGKTGRNALLNQIKQSDISPKAAMDATSAIHGWFAQRKAEARADAQEILTPMQKAQQALAYYQTINDPNFVKMTDAQILGKVPELGLAGTVQIMADLQAARTNPQKIHQIHLDQEVAESAAKEFGLISGDKPNPAEKLKIATMQAQAKAIIQASGKPAWPYEEQRNLYRELSKQIITDRGVFWDTKKPFFEARQTTAVPDAFVKTVMDEAQAAKVPAPSSSTLLQLWLDAKAKGLVDDKGNKIGRTAPQIVTGATK